MEGDPVTFNWTYDLQGRSFRQMIFTNSDIFSIVQQFLSQTLSFEDGFLDRVKVDFNVTHTSYASFTFLAVYRNDSNSYTFSVQSDRGGTKSPEVELNVLCKYKQLYIFEELNFICLVFAGYLSLLVDLKASEARRVRPPQRPEKGKQGKYQNM